MKHLKILLLSSMIILFTACGGSSSSGDTPIVDDPQDVAIAKIMLYAEDDTNTAPTVLTYEVAGVEGVTEDNINDVNEVVASLTPEDVNTTEKIQKIVNDLAINIPPTANAGPNRYAEVGQSIKITGSGTDTDGTISSYRWTKGSSVLATTASFYYTPTSIGTDTLTLTVTDDEGETASDKMNVIVTDAYIPPVADAGINQTITDGDSVTLDGSASSGEIIDYVWKEGNETLATTQSFTKYDFTVGTHTITLTVTDDKDTADSDTIIITVNPVSPGSSQIKKTGQINSYNSGGEEVIDGSIKDDGYYQAGITPSYTNNNGIVEDHVTGLEWQDDYSDNGGDIKTATWVEAADYCTNLVLDGGSWRLPTITELNGIVKDSAYNPSIETTAFTNNASTPNSATNNYTSYWSSTDSVGYANPVAWLVDFVIGFTHGYGKLATHHVRCVRVGI